MKTAETDEHEFNRQAGLRGWAELSSRPRGASRYLRVFHTSYFGRSFLDEIPCRIPRRALAPFFLTPFMAASLLCG
jgi:hypothetical protein